MVKRFTKPDHFQDRRIEYINGEEVTVVEDMTMDLVSVITATRDNPALPPGYVSNYIAKHADNPEIIDRNIYADMSFRTGMV